MSKFKFGDYVRHKLHAHKTFGIVVDLNGKWPLIKWEGAACTELTHESLLELIPNPDTGRLMYLVENEKLVLLDDDCTWSVVNAIPEYYEGNRRLSREFDFRHAIDKAMEMETPSYCETTEITCGRDI